MRLHEVGNLQYRNVKETAQAIVHAWIHQRSNERVMAWLYQLSSDEHLLAKLLKGSRQYDIYGGDGNEPFLDSAFIHSSAFNILSKLNRINR